ncbi:MAG: hypothetical protein FJW31_13270 [Acidobacteria bacterium]|nr:hypothetical protein [Acidobacteriota bacterium]
MPLHRHRRAPPVAVTDGALQVCFALASVTNLVTVDAAAEPFAVAPDDVFARTFDDLRVGLSHQQMPIFKANLAGLLPRPLAPDVARIADDAGLAIGDVADFIAAALRKTVLP